MEPVRRVDLPIGIGYDEDLEKAKAVILEALANTPKVLKDPAPFVGVVGFGDSSVDLAVRPTALSEDYWDVYFTANEAVKEALDKHNIEIPYPHQVEIRKQGQAIERLRIQLINRENQYFVLFEARTDFNCL